MFFEGGLPFLGLCLELPCARHSDGDTHQTSHSMYHEPEPSVMLVVVEYILSLSNPMPPMYRGYLPWSLRILHLEDLRFNHEFLVCFRSTPTHPRIQSCPPMKVSGFDLILKIGKPSFCLAWMPVTSWLHFQPICVPAESPRYYLSSEAFGWRRLLIHVVTWAARDRQFISVFLWVLYIPGRCFGLLPSIVVSSKGKAP